MYNPNENFAISAYEHYYHLALVNNGKEEDVDTIYASRQMAEKAMYRLVDQLHTKIVKQYDDNHDKTYICDNNVSFYITRYC